jgi:hypothetical protein
MAYIDIVQRTTLMLPRLFRRHLKKGPDVQWLYISGTLYMREGSNVVMIPADQLREGVWIGHGGSSSFETCSPDHIAPNGVSVQQIAYALAMIEGAISISSTPQCSRQSSGIGWN